MYSDFYVFLAVLILNFYTTYFMAMCYLLFVFGYIIWHTGFIKHICYGNSLFGCFIIYSSQLVLASTAFYKLYHFGIELAHACRCAAKPY